MSKIEDDEYNKMLHAVEHMSTFLNRDLPSLLRSFYDGLIEQKFTPAEALFLTNSYMTHTLFSKKEGGEDV
jgi:dsDNA-binding SOS-regulon protein